MHRLTVNEESTHIDVNCDGFTFRIYTNGEQDYLVYILDGSDVLFWDCVHSILDAGTTYYHIGHDDNTEAQLYRPGVHVEFD